MASWFSGYQTMRIKGKVISEGWRDKTTERLDKFDINDIKGKTVLDIGCNDGSLLFWALDNGAKEVFGIDTMKENLENAVHISKKYGYDVNLMVANILQNNFVEDVRKKFDINAFDTVMFLSLYRSIDRDKPSMPPENPQEIFNKLDTLTNKVIYFEAHFGDPEREYVDILKKHLDGYEIVYLGENGDHDKGVSTHTRPMFRCVKD
jgi:SAM-dependent methyltransferase